MMNLPSIHEQHKNKKVVNDFFRAQLHIPEYLSRFIRFQPFEKSTPILELDYLFVDIETSGLNANSDSILSIGWVCLKDGRLDLSSARHHYIKTHSPINFSNATVHHILPEMLERGSELESVFKEMFQVARGGRIVVHGACVEARFFSTYFKAQYYSDVVPILYLDTILIEKFFAMKHRLNESDFRLTSTRKRYELPDYLAHNALVDAIATAELFLCQVERLALFNKRHFGDLCKIAEVIGR